MFDMYIPHTVVDIPHTVHAHMYMAYMLYQGCGLFISTERLKNVFKMKRIELILQRKD